MDIERVSENQIKFVLNQSDLKKRDIKIGELAYGSEKTQELFREMMLQAMLEYDFHTENTPLMIEAIPMSSDSIIIIVTKVSGSDDIEDRFNIFNSKRDLTKLKRRLKLDSKNKVGSLANSFIIYSFDSLDLIISLSNRINKINYHSSIYKYEDKYYLILEKNDNINFIEFDEDLSIDSILSEYGQKHISNYISQYFLIEHGEAIIKEDALAVLDKYLS